jgi:glycosyltransferase involved in cell wall biosynthesis
MARILLLTELLPYPLISGAKIRAYYVLRHLAARHEVTLVSFVRADDRPEDVAHLETFLHGVHAVPMQRSWRRNARAALVSLLTGRPATIAREQIGAMRRAVESLLASGRPVRGVPGRPPGGAPTPAWFDVVHADQIPMAQYGLMGQGGRARRLLDQHNATFQIVERLARQERQGWKRLLLEREARAFARYEAEVCRRFDHVTFVTEEDRQALSARMGDSPAGHSTVIPICVDSGGVQPVRPVAAPLRVTHVGTMYWPPNVEGILWFWEQVWPQVRAQVPDARLTLIGKNPPEPIRALDGRPGVDVPGYVEDLAPYLAETAAFVVPLHAAGGMRVKIVNAWCWGLPIVSTTIGAEGIAIRDGENILIADTPGAFAQAVVQVLRSLDLQRRLRAKGRAWVEERYDWRRVYAAWDDVYDRLLRG